MAMVAEASRRVRFSTRAKPAENSFTNIVSVCHAWLVTRSRSDDRLKVNVLSALPHALIQLSYGNSESGNNF
jgi:hypothetical protein